MATLDSDDLVAIAALLLSGGVRLADAVAHGGATATLAMQKIALSNSDGDATVSILGSNGNECVEIRGTGATGGIGIDTEIGVCLEMSVGSLNACISMQGGGPGVSITGYGAPGIAINTIGGTHTISLHPQDGDGININPILSVGPAATGISVVGAGTGPAVQLGDGSSGAMGLRILSAPDGTALSIEGDATGMLITGRGGLVITGNDGVGVQIGGTDAPGILVQASLVVSSSMSAVVLAGAGTGSGFDGTLSPATLASFFLVDTAKVYTDAVSGSVVKEIASNAGGGGSDPNVMFSGVLGDQSLGDVDHIVLPSGPSDNGVLVGSRLRITSGAGQYQERTISSWFGTNKIAGIDMPLNAVEQAPGDAFQVLYDHSYQLDPSGSVLSIAEVSGFFDYALAQFVTLDTTKTASDIAAGSVVYLSRHSIAGIGF